MTIITVGSKLYNSYTAKETAYLAFEIPYPILEDDGFFSEPCPMCIEDEELFKEADELYVAIDRAARAGEMEIVGADYDKKGHLKIYYIKAEELKKWFDTVGVHAKFLEVRTDLVSRYPGSWHSISQITRHYVGMALTYPTKLEGKSLEEKNQIWSDEEDFRRLNGISKQKLNSGYRLMDVLIKGCGLNEVEHRKTLEGVYYIHINFIKDWFDKNKFECPEFFIVVEVEDKRKLSFCDVFLDLLHIPMIKKSDLIMLQNLTNENHYEKILPDAFHFLPAWAEKDFDINVKDVNDAYETVLDLVEDIKDESIRAEYGNLEHQWVIDRRVYIKWKEKYYANSQTISKGDINHSSAKPNDNHIHPGAGDTQSTEIIKPIKLDRVDYWNDVLYYSIDKYEIEFNLAPTLNALCAYLIKNPPKAFQALYNNEKARLESEDQKPLDKENFSKRYNRLYLKTTK